MALCFKVFDKKRRNCRGSKQRKRGRRWKAYPVIIYMIAKSTKFKINRIVATQRIG